MKSRNLKLLPLVLIAALSFSLAFYSAHAQAGVLYVSPSAIPGMPVGSTFNIKIQVANIDPFNAWDISVMSDPTLFSPQSLSITGNLLAINFSTTVFELINCINGAGTGCIATDGAGIAHSAVTGFGPPPQTTTSSGILFTITYRVIGAGSSPIHIFSDVIANGATGAAVPHFTIDGVYNPDLPPVASFTVTGNNTVTGSTVSFNGGASADPDGTIASYAWTFGDGGTATGVTTTHVYTVAGMSPVTFPVTLTVTDNSGSTGTASAKVVVLPAPVIFDLAVTNVVPSPTSVLAGTPVTISVTVSNAGPAASPSTTATATAGGTSVGTAPVSALNAGQSTTVTITWDTTTFSGTLTIAASVPVLMNDGNPANNAFTDGTVTVQPIDCHFVHGKLSWTHHLVLSKNSAGQTFTAHVRCDTSGPEYVQVSVVGMNGVGATFSAMSAATLVQIGVVTDITFSQTVDPSFDNTKIAFTSSVHWGDTAATVMTHLSPITKSGAFAVVP